MGDDKDNHECHIIPSLNDIERIRRRPGMYIGGLGSEGINHMVCELFDDSLDLHLAGQCRTIRVETGSPISVSDDGPGFPEGDVIEAAIEMDNSATFDGDQPQRGYRRGLFKFNPLIVVNALSRMVTIESCEGSQCRRWRFVDRELVEESWHRRPRGFWTRRVCFWPDPSVLNATTVDRERLLAELVHVPWLYPGLRFEIDDQRFEHPGGLPAWVRAHTGIDIHHCVLEQPDTRVEAAWGWADQRSLAGFVNRHPSPLGSHVQGLEHGVARALKKPVAEVRKHLVGIIHVMTEHPSFTSVTRERFKDDDIQRWIAQGIADHLRRAQPPSSPNKNS